MKPTFCCNSLARSISYDSQLRVSVGQVVGTDPGYFDISIMEKCGAGEKVITECPYCGSRLTVAIGSTNRED